MSFSDKLSSISLADNWLNAKRYLIFAACLFLNSGCAFDTANQRIFPATWTNPEFCQQQLHGNIYCRTELYFGLSNPTGVITEEEFQNFMDAEVTPRFPDGLTVISAKGQFKSSKGSIVNEDSKLLILFYIFSDENNNRVERIREAYQEAFQQESVMRVDEQSCVSF